MTHASGGAEHALMRRTVAAVALLNLAYFGVEYAVATAIGSVSLFADSIDFLEDASLNLMVLLAIGWSAAMRRRVGILLALVLLVPGIAALWTVWTKLGQPIAPEPAMLTLAGFGALLVNATCALLLTRVRLSGGSLTRAAYLSARNDVAANIAIIAAGAATYATGSIWPDIIVGLGIAAINADAAHEVYEAAMDEDRDERDAKA